MSHAKKFISGGLSWYSEAVYKRPSFMQGYLTLFVIQRFLHLRPAVGAVCKKSHKWPLTAAAATFIANLSRIMFNLNPVPMRPQALGVNGGRIIYSFDNQINHPYDLNRAIFSPLIIGFASKFQKLLTKMNCINQSNYLSAPPISAWFSRNRFANSTASLSASACSSANSRYARALPTQSPSNLGFSFNARIPYVS